MPPEKDHPALLNIMKSVPHLTYKLEAFVRLPAAAVNRSVLRLLAREDFRYVSERLMEKVLTQILRGGWTLWPARQYQSCFHCQGTGKLSLKCISANSAWSDHDVFPCPECDGKGKILFKRVTCQRNAVKCVTFHFPA